MSLLPLRRWARHARSPILTRLLLQLSVAAALLVVCGVVYWRIEPTTPRLVDALWLAFVTASTIGYGDLVPSTPGSRVFSVLVVLLGFGVLSLVTAAIAATWVESTERQVEREILRDIHHRMQALHEDVASLRRELQAREEAATHDRA